MIVRDFQCVIGNEAKRQIIEQEGRLPDYLVACVGGGSNSIGLFHPFFNDKDVRFIGVEAAGLGLKTKKHAATLVEGDIGVLHGALGYVLQDKDGQIDVAHSVAAGLDYPGVGPEHAYYKEIGRAKYFASTDKEALDAFKLLSEIEGMMPALEAAHAIAYVEELAPRLGKQKIIVMCLSGRGDKDVDIAIQYFGKKRRLEA